MKSRKDETRTADKSPRAKTNGDDLQRALTWALTDGIFSDVRRHGNVSWTPFALVGLAMFWVWSPEAGLVEAATSAIARVKQLFGSAAVNSYQALTNALVRYTPQLLPILWRRTQQLMQQSGETTGWRLHGWLVLAFDGSRVSVPRTRNNETRFCKPPRKHPKHQKSRRKKRGRHARPTRQTKRTKSHYDPQPVGPQIWLTLLWHVGLRLPWSWKLGPSYASERADVLELLQTQQFPEKTLFCGDAGFVGYNFWRRIVDGGHQFLVRVGGNVRLLKKLGTVCQRSGTVSCWPEDAMKKKQPPLMLRLLHFHDGRAHVYLVTSVLDQQALTDWQAGEIYRRRWGIELQFRSLKQTYGRGKLRARTPDIAEVELHWSLLGLALLQLLALKEQSVIGEPPEKTSVATVLRIIREIIAQPSEPRSSRATLFRRLRRATTDSYKRRSSKKSRNYPRRKEEPRTGKPIITTATAKHRKRLKDIMCALNLA